jgi:hypothetical protein
MKIPGLAEIPRNIEPAVRKILTNYREVLTMILSRDKGSDKTLKTYFGDSTALNADGNWRLRVDVAGDLVLQKMVGNTWTTTDTFTV